MKGEEEGDRKEEGGDRDGVGKIGYVYSIGHLDLMHSNPLQGYAYPLTQKLCL